MEFSKVISSRRSIRKFKKDPIPEEKLCRLYEALNFAPSGNNRQPYKFIFLKDEKKRHEVVSQACHQKAFLDAPVLMIAVCEKGRSFDTAIAVDHMVLAATDEGLGTCWVGWFDRQVVRKLLEIPEEMEIPILVPVGYADESPAARPRKPLDELISIDKY